MVALLVASLLTCALIVGTPQLEASADDDDGLAVYGWGAGGSPGGSLYGLLGKSYRKSAYHPRGMTDVVSFAFSQVGSSEQVTAVRADGSVWSWGEGLWSTPLQYPDSDKLGKVVKVFGSRYGFYYLKKDGSVYSHVDDDEGAAGDGAKKSSFKKVVRVKGLTGVVDIVEGRQGMYALKSNGDVWVWGPGESADGKEIVRHTPERFPGLAKVVSLTSSSAADYALRSDGSVWAWGASPNGELGIGVETSWDDSEDHLVTPVKVHRLRDVVSITADHATSSAYALRSDGTLWAWGANGYGELGDGTKTSRSAPVQVSGLPEIKSVVARGGPGWTAVAYAIGKDGTLWTWGHRAGKTPVRVPGLTKVTSVETNGETSFAVTSNGTLWGWGVNRCGQLGDGTTKKRSTPVRVSTVSGVTHVTILGFQEFPTCGKTSATVFSSSGATVFVLAKAPKADKIRTPLSTVYLTPWRWQPLLATAQLKNTRSLATVTYTSSNPKVLAVRANGEINSKRVAKATKVTVTIKAAKASKKVTVWVVPKESKVKASASVAKTMKVGTVSWVTASAKKGTNAHVTFASSKESVVTVDKYGKLTAKKKGKAKITVKVGDKSVKKTVTVK